MEEDTVSLGELVLMAIAEGHTKKTIDFVITRGNYDEVVKILFGSFVEKPLFYVYTPLDLLQGLLPRLSPVQILFIAGNYQKMPYCENEYELNAVHELISKSVVSCLSNLGSDKRKALFAKIIESTKSNFDYSTGLKQLMSILQVSDLVTKNHPLWGVFAQASITGDEGDPEAVFKSLEHLFILNYLPFAAWETTP